VVGDGEFPLQAALVIDRSASMRESLARVTAAAAAFARAAPVAPGDRLAVFSFADRLTVDSGFSDRTADLERALAGLVARGGTALYESVAAAAAAFGEAPGQKALVLFTDGGDEGSEIGLAGAIDAAQRWQVSVFAIGLAEAFPGRAARRAVERLAEETGGGLWLITGLDELAGVYEAILARLRGRYLLAFTAPEEAGDAPRRLRIEVDRPGARIDAPDAYYP
jgi:VWFA-related protein